MEKRLTMVKKVSVLIAIALLGVASPAVAGQGERTVVVTWCGRSSELVPTADRTGCGV